LGEKMIDVLFHVNDPYKSCEGFPLHQHTYCEFEYILDGELDTVLPQGVMRLRKGQFVFHPPWTPHEVRNTGKPVHLLFVLTSKYPKYIPANIPIDDTPEALYGKIFREMLEEYKYQRPLRNIEIFFCWQDLLDAYCHQFCEVIGRDDVVSRIYRILNDNLSNPYFNIEHGFSDIGFSVDSLRRIFKKSTGTTLKEYLLDARISNACNLMMMANKKKPQIKDVAIQCGFRDPLYFSRIFRSRMHISPRDFLNGKGRQYLKNTTFLSLADQYPISCSIPVLSPVFSERFEIE
jgi:AraC-like DNA-binding protein